MANIELEFVSSISGRVAINKGSTVPPWFNNEDNYSRWYDDKASYFYNMLEGSTNTLYIQYGRNFEGWGSGRFFVQEVQILSENEKTDGSIDVTVRARLLRFRQRITEMTGTPFDVNYRISVLGNVVYTYNGTAGDNINEGSSGWYTESYNVKPSETIQETGIQFFVGYPNGEVGDSNLFLGFGLHNPNPPTYVPMAIRKNGNWKDLDSNNGKIKRRINGTWKDKSEENLNTSREIDKGKNRIRRNGNWRQLPKMKGSATT